MDLPFDPFRIRVVEPIRPVGREEREAAIREAGYNPFLLRSEAVLVDLVSDSGVSAMSVRQWAALHAADESFSGSASYYRFVEAARSVFGKPHVIPCHQGRAAEHLLARVLVRPGQLVVGNTLFATTRANVERAGARAVDLPVPEAREPREPHPFKGNIDLEALERALEDAGRGGTAFVVITVTDNSTAGQPVSLANLRAASEICRGHGVPLLLDAARIAENAALLRERERGLERRTPGEIVREMADLADGVFMSLKKDALGGSGGLIALDEADLAARIGEELVVTEGLPSGGGLAPRDLEAAAVALVEMLDASHLEWRLAEVARLTASLDAAGVPVLLPAGGHAVYIDGRAFCPHLPDELLPAWSLSVALYLESGIRGWEVGNVTYGRRDPETGEWRWPPLDLFRLAIPRRVYTRTHLEYVAREVAALHARRDTVRGLRFAYRPGRLPQFIARFEPA